MFNNIGKKIKGFVTFLCVLGFILVGLAAIGGIIGGIIVMVRGGILAGVLTIFGAIVGAALGALFVWLGCFVFYGYGELIDKTADIAKNTELTAQKVTKLEYEFETRK